MRAALGAGAQVHHQRRAQEQRQFHHPPPVVRQLTARRQHPQQRPPDLRRLELQQPKPHRARPPIVLDMQRAALAARSGAIPLRRLAGLIQPQRMRKDIVERGLDLGQQRRDMAARERRIKQRKLAAAAKPHIGVMRIAMRGDAAIVGQAFRTKPDERLIEQVSQRPAIAHAVDHEQQGFQFLPAHG